MKTVIFLPLYQLCSGVISLQNLTAISIWYAQQRMGKRGCQMILGTEQMKNRGLHHEQTKPTGDKKRSMHPNSFNFGVLIGGENCKISHSTYIFPESSVRGLLARAKTSFAWHKLRTKGNSTTLVASTKFILTRAAFLPARNSRTDNFCRSFTA